MTYNDIFINGVDFTSLFKRRDLPYETVEVSGPNGGTMQSGRIVTDVIARHLKIVRHFRPLTAAQLWGFTTTLTIFPYAMVRVLDAVSGGERDFECIYAVPTSTYLYTDRYGGAWFSLSDLTLRERG